MADSPVRMLVKIGDPTTAANEAAVSASGELSVILAANDGVDVGDVGIGSFDATLTDADDDIVAFAAQGLRTISLLYGSDGVQWERITTNGSGAMDVDLGANNDITIEGGAVVGTDGGAGPADCLSIGGTESGGNIQEILVDASGALQVDVLSGGGESTPTGHVAVRGTTTDLAVDGTFNVDEAEAGGTTSKCRGFDASASVPIKAELQEVNDGTGTPKVTLFAAAGEPIHWRAPHRDYFETAFSANAGFDGWRVVITNKDSTDAADVYGTLYTEN